LSKFVKQRLNELQPSRELQLLAGIIVSVRTQMTRRGKMAIVLLDDATAPLEVVVFSETFDAYRDWIKEDELLIVEGKVSDDAYSGGLRVTADKVYDLAHARNRFARELRLSCNGQSNSAKLKEILTPYRSQEGGCPVTVAYHNGKAACEVSLGGAWQVQLHDHLIETLGQWLEPASVQVRY
jgi:DNA polymerase-3 subunit alpha